MKLAILDLTLHPSPLLDGLPRASAQIGAWLAPALPEARFATHDVAHGAPLPTPADFDGLIVSGSEHGVYDAPPWMASLRALLQATRAAAKPIYGICFGHQIMADTFGGKAEKATSGYAIGAYAFHHRDRTVDAHFWHQDQVTRVPPGANVTGRAAHCPVSALEYDFPAKSVQFHPEFTQPNMLGLFERGRDVFITGAQADAATLTLQKAKVPGDLAADDAAALFRNPVAAG